MRLHEFEAADIFESFGIPVPLRRLVETPEEAKNAALALGFPVMLKAQVLVGGRGLSGGIARAESGAEASVKAQQLLDSSIKGIRVESLLIEKKVEIERELYIAMAVDGFSGKTAAIAGNRGGMSVEAMSQEFPGSLVSELIPPGRALYPYEAQRMFKSLGLNGKVLLAATGSLVRLSKVFVEREAIIAEINPLAVIADGSVSAVDAVLEIDDSAVKRQSGNLPRTGEISSNSLEALGREIGVSYIDLDGDIGIISSGAGLGMATMDIVAQKLRPANFLETGGGITEQLLYNTMDLMMRKEGLRGVLINLYGGINPIHEGAKGVVRYVKEHNITIPIVAKALGNHQEETWRIFEEAGVVVVRSVATEVAVERLAELLRPSE